MTVRGVLSLFAIAAAVAAPTVAGSPSAPAECLVPVAKAGGPVRTFGGSGNSSDLFRSVALAEDGGYLLGGGMNFALWLLKVDGNWREEWSRVYGFGTVWAVETTSDGGYIAAGDVNLAGLSDQLWVQKLSAKGKIEFEVTLGGAMRDYAYAVQETADGGFIVAGQTQSAGAGDYDAWLVRLSRSGKVAWQKTYGGEAYDDVTAVREATGGGFVATGYTYLNGGFGNLWLFKVDDDGDVIWELTYGGDELPERGEDLIETADGGFLVVGEWFASAWVLRLDAEGMPLWQERLSDPHAIVWVDAVISTADRGFIVSGRTDLISNDLDSPNAWVVKLTATGKDKWHGVLGFPYRFDRAYEVEELPDKSLLAVGATYSLGQGGDGLIWGLSRKGRSCGNLFTKVDLERQATAIAPVVTHALVGDTPFVPNTKKSKSQKKSVQGFVNCGG